MTERAGRQGKAATRHLYFAILRSAVFVCYVFVVVSQAARTRRAARQARASGSGFATAPFPPQHQSRICATRNISGFSLILLCFPFPYARPLCRARKQFCPSVLPMPTTLSLASSWPRGSGPRWVALRMLYMPGRCVSRLCLPLLCISQCLPTAEAKATESGQGQDRPQEWAFCFLPAARPRHRSRHVALGWLGPRNRQARKVLLSVGFEPPLLAAFYPIFPALPPFS